MSLDQKYFADRLQSADLRLRLSSRLILLQRQSFAIYEKRALWIGALDLDVIDKILAGELDASVLRDLDLDRLGRRSRLVGTSRRVLFAPGWRPELSPHGLTSCHAKSVSTESQLCNFERPSAFTVRQADPGSAHATPSLFPARRQARRPNWALGAAAAILAIFLLPVSNTEDSKNRVGAVDAMAGASPVSPTSPLLDQPRATRRPVRDLAAVPVHPLASFMTSAAPSSVVPTRTVVSTNSERAASRAAPTEAAVAVTITAARMLPVSFQSAEIPMPPPRPMGQLKHAEGRRRTAVAVRFNSAVATLQLPDSLKPEP